MDNGTKRSLGFESALLVSWGVIAGAFAGAVLAWWVGASGLGVLLMAVSVTGLASRLWGMASLRGIDVTAVPERETLSVGQSVRVRYTMRNDKALPLVWAEVCQDVPVRDCLVPDGSFRLRAFTEEEAARTGRKTAYVRRLSFIPGCDTLSWDTTWTGARRGVYRPQELLVRSGDGFGLTQSTGRIDGMRGRVMVVWPLLVPVRTAPFLRHVWTGTTGRAGWAEDPSVMRGERAYQPGDPWKRIDWRTAARTDEIMVRQFDTVTPLSLLFVLDAASFPDGEEAISITASVIHALGLIGICCGLALPATDERGPLVLRPGDPAVTPERCLFALAEFAAESAGGVFDERAIAASAGENGRVWIVTQGADSLSCPGLAARLTGMGACALTAVRGQGGPVAAACTFDEIRRKEGAP